MFARLPAKSPIDVWRSSYPAIVLAGCTLLVHILVNSRYGIFSDELYFIVCGQHPAMGYVDQPPLIPLIAGLSHSWFGTALLPLRLIPALAMALTVGLTQNVNKLSLLHAPFVLGLITGGAMIYWFTGASTQAVTTGAYRAVEFIKRNIRLEGVEKASVADSKKVVAICTQYAQKGMFTIFLAVFFATLAFAFVEPFYFIGYLFSIAIFGLYQAIFMANAGASWDNAKKIVEVELKQKGTELHAAMVIGDTVGDPFKDTSSVALNPVIKFTTLFGLLAVELAVKLTADRGSIFSHVLALGFFLLSVIFVYRSFYSMRIRTVQASSEARVAAD